ncbi:hypothetical protein N7539_000400 [Penicillium diatomitis]|uniref:Uncharacterized protein n=1 Tax=Penicillium diatomitis TaxID=2819901 RepID=A0A9W9XLQ4_9EURO|nr:uncharacterized protein N7539_000400 [Penicillium diatomitis]KAJ5495284.1 hypothetical protein N7539_000400 [Penicillium diatomitis]
MSEEQNMMQQPACTVQSMYPNQAGGDSSLQGANVETQRAFDPRTTIEDYNRTMLEYTQRQISSFVDLDENNNSNGTRSRSSQSSGNSEASSHSNDSRHRTGSSSPTSVNPGRATSTRDMAEGTHKASAKHNDY